MRRTCLPSHSDMSSHKHLHMLCFSRFLAQCVSAERAAPFFPLLSAHLSCAMTHIEGGIQEDALKVLDVLLEHYPALLASRPSVLLTNFLELISHRRSGASSSGGSKKPQDAMGSRWALTVNPSKAMTGQQWRLSVLLRYMGNLTRTWRRRYKASLIIPSQLDCYKYTCECLLNVSQSFTCLSHAVICKQSWTLSGLKPAYEQKSKLSLHAVLGLPAFQAGAFYSGSSRRESDRGGRYVQPK